MVGWRAAERFASVDRAERRGAWVGCMQQLCFDVRKKLAIFVFMTTFEVLRYRLGQTPSWSDVAVYSLFRLLRPGDVECCELRKEVHRRIRWYVVVHPPRKCLPVIGTFVVLQERWHNDTCGSTLSFSSINAREIPDVATVVLLVPRAVVLVIGPGGRGQLPTRGSHGSGRAPFGHPAPQIMVSLLNGTHCARRAQGGGDRC